MYECEIKIKLRDPQKTIEKLENLSATAIHKIRHVDRYFNSPEELPSFEKTDEALRIRTSKVKDLTSKDEKECLSHDLTYKGPKMDAVVKTRVEHVAKIFDPAVLEKIFLALGFKKVISLEKVRTAYSLAYKGNTIEILIDQVEHLSGTFLEAELMAERETDTNKLKEVLISFLEEIGYGENDTIIDSYLELVLKKQGLLD